MYSRPAQVRLDAVEHDEVVGAARCGRPGSRWPATTPGAVSPSTSSTVGPLLGEVVERVGVDLADRRRAPSVSYGRAPPSPRRRRRTSRSARSAGPGGCSGASPSTSSASTSSTVMARPYGASAVGVVLDEVVDAAGEGLDVGRVDGREHADAQLVAAELAVAVGVDDRRWRAARRRPVGVERVVEVDRADDGRALGRVGDERRGPLPRLGPAVEVRRRRLRSASTHQSSPPMLEHPPQLVGRAAAASRPPACCTSGRGGCCRARSRGRATPDASGRTRRCARCARRRPASRRRATARRRRRSTSAGRSSRRRPRPDPTAGRRRPRWRRRRRGVGRSPAGRRSSIATPVEVSLWVRA